MNKNFVFLMLFVAFGLIAVPQIAIAQSDTETANLETVGPAPGWLMVVGKFGGSSDGTAGTITFDDVPRGEDEELEYVGLHNGYVDLGVETLFFPTQGRRFLLSAGYLYKQGHTMMDFDDNDYAATVGLDNRQLQYQTGYLVGGIGYRWLYGETMRHMSTLHFNLGLGSTNYIIDGLGGFTAGSGLIGVGTKYMYRFPDRMAAGVQFDLRFWGSGAEAIEFDSYNSDFDFSQGGIGGVLSFVVGFEAG